jgi:hypothetical protein
MTKSARIAFRVIGGLSLFFAVAGLLYNIGYLTAIISAYKPDPEAPFFWYAFLIMSSICVVCYLLLIFLGIQFLRLRHQGIRIFVALMIFEIVYVLALSLLWNINMNQTVAMSIAAATGVANGGLMVQLVTLFPLWAPFVVFWASKQRLGVSGREGV